MMTEQGERKAGGVKGMEEYQSLEIEVIEFETTDVITSSDGCILYDDFVKE